MLNLSSESRIYLCTGCTDMRKGINGLSILAQSILLNQFHKSILFVFRGKQADKIKYYGGMVKLRQEVHRRSIEMCACFNRDGGGPSEAADHMEASNYLMLLQFKRCGGEQLRKRHDRMSSKYLIDERKQTNRRGVETRKCHQN